MRTAPTSTRATTGAARPYRLAEGSKQSFQFQAFPETAVLLAELGANTRLGVPGTVQERADRAVTDTAVP